MSSMRGWQPHHTGNQRRKWWQMSTAVVPAIVPAVVTASPSTSRMPRSSHTTVCQPQPHRLVLVPQCWCWFAFPVLPREPPCLAHCAHSLPACIPRVLIFAPHSLLVSWAILLLRHLVPVLHLLATCSRRNGGSGIGGGCVAKHVRIRIRNKIIKNNKK